MENEKIFLKFRCNPPASAAEIHQFEASVGLKLPKDYVEFLQWTNGGVGFIGPNAFVRFWRLEELAEKNKAYEVAEYAPGLFIFGSDGGGEAYAFDIRTSAMSIVEIPFVGMELKVALVMASTFSRFLDVLSKV